MADPIELTLIPLDGRLECAQLAPDRSEGTLGRQRVLSGDGALLALESTEGRFGASGLGLGISEFGADELETLPDRDCLFLEVGARVVRDARTLVRALGYDMNSIEFAIRDGVPYAIDFMNPAPDMDVNSLTPHYFEWVVQRMADLAIRLALEPRPQAREMRWQTLFGGAPAAPAPDAPPPRRRKAATKK